MSELFPSNRVNSSATPPCIEATGGSRLTEPEPAASFTHAESLAALRESEEQFRVFFELAAMGAAQADVATGRLLRVNDRFCEITGYSRAELLLETVRNLTHPEDQAADWEKFQRMIRGETRDYDAEKRYIRKDLRVIWIHVTSTAIRDAQGRPLRTVGLIQDITERKRAQEALRLSEERFRAQYKHFPIPIFTYQARENGVFVLVDYNDAGGTLTQGRAAELIGWTAD